MNSWLTWLIKRRRIVLASHLLVLFVASLGLPRLAIDNSPQAFFVDNAVEVEQYERYRRFFGRDQTLRIALRGEGLWTREGLAYMAQLEREVGATFGIVGTAGLYSHHRWRWPAWPPIQPGQLREEATRDALDLAAGWTTVEGDIASIMALTYDLTPAQVRTLSDRLEEIASQSPPGIEATVVGLPILASALDRAVFDVAKRIFPILVAISVLLLIVVLRSPASVLVVLAQVGWVFVLVFGVIGWQAHTLDMIQSILAPIVFVVTLANALYLWVELQYRRRCRPATEEGSLSSLIAAYGERGWAVLWTGVTTIVGFGSLTLSASPPIRDLGMWTAFGLAIATAEAFLLYPVLLSLLPTRRRHRAGSGKAIEVSLRPVGRALALWSVNHRGRVLLAFFSLAAVVGSGVLRLETGVGLLDYFGRATPVRVDLEAVQANGIGVVAADLVLERRALEPQSSGLHGDLDFSSPEALSRISELATTLRALPEVIGTLSASELVDAGRRLDDQAGQNRVRDSCSAQELLRSIPDTAVLLKSAITPDGAAARISIFLPFLPLSRLDQTFEAALEASRRSFPESRVWITGTYPLVLESQRSLLRTMMLSLGLTLLFVAVIFATLVRRLRTLLVALAPNLWPVLFVLGFMGWAGIRLDATTLMIAAVVLSLSVDDTLHTLGAFRLRAPGAGAREGAVATIEHTFSGHVLTTLVLASGFALCTLSSFIPVAQFGGLVALALVMALVADLVLMPVLLAQLTPGDLAALQASSEPQ